MKLKKHINGKIKGSRGPGDIEGIICGVHGPHFAPGQGPLHIAKKRVKIFGFTFTFFRDFKKKKEKS